jgi:hypothetical protein
MEQVIGKLNVHPKEQLTSEVDISVVEVNLYRLILNFYIYFWTFTSNDIKNFSIKH